MTHRFLTETFSAPPDHRIDALLTMSDLLGARALTVFAAAAASLWSGHDFAECGVADGVTAAGLAKLIQTAKGQPALLHLFDVFDSGQQIAARNDLAAQTVQGHARSVEAVKALVGSDRVVYRPGVFADTLRAFNGPLAFVHADADLYESTVDIIDMIDRCVVPGGVVVFDDYGTEWTGVTKAVDERLLRAQGWSTYAVTGVGQLVAWRVNV